MFYSVILVFMTSNTFGQYNRKQKHKGEQKWMKMNGLILSTIGTNHKQIETDKKKLNY